ncbi:MAG TPA: SCO family protein [Edaphocola sp.]|nr:SCO family protein [Edaphocola sp.]
MIGIAVALLLPLFSWLLFKNISKGIVKIPKHYGISFVDTLKDKDGKLQYDTVYRSLSDISLTNQLGKMVDLNQDLRGKILVINFINTRRTDISNKMMGNLHLLQQSYQKKGNLDWLQFVSITVDPAKDNVPALRHYADQFEVNHDHWWLLTGDSAAIYRYGHKELALDMPLNNGAAKGPFDQVVLVDTFRHIRGYFNAVDTMELQRLADDISILTMEKQKRKKK